MNNLHNHQQQENHRINRGSHKSTIPHEVNKPFKLHQFNLASGASIVENFLSSGRLPAFVEQFNNNNIQINFTNYCFYKKLIVLIKLIIRP